MIDMFLIVEMAGHQRRQGGGSMMTKCEKQKATWMCNMICVLAMY